MGGRHSALYFSRRFHTGNALCTGIERSEMREGRKGWKQQVRVTDRVGFEGQVVL